MSACVVQFKQDFYFRTILTAFKPPNAPNSYGRYRQRSHLRTHQTSRGDNRDQKGWLILVARASMHKNSNYIYQNCISRLLCFFLSTGEWAADRQAGGKAAGRVGRRRSGTTGGPAAGRRRAEETADGTLRWTDGETADGRAGGTNERPQMCVGPPTHDVLPALAHHPITGSPPEATSPGHVKISGTAAAANRRGYGRRDQLSRILKQP